MLLNQGFDDDEFFEDLEAEEKAILPEVQVDRIMAFDDQYDNEYYEHNDIEDQAFVEAEMMASQLYYGNMGGELIQDLSSGSRTNSPFLVNDLKEQLQPPFQATPLEEYHDEYLPDLRIVDDVSSKALQPTQATQNLDNCSIYQTRLLLDQEKLHRLRLESALLERVGEVSFARTKIHQLDELNSKLKASLASQNAGAEQASQQAKGKMEAEVEKLKNEVRFKVSYSLTLGSRDQDPSIDATVSKQYCPNQLSSSREQNILLS